MFSIDPVAFAAPGASMICRAPHHAGNSETRLSAPNACHACGHDAAPPTPASTRNAMRAAKSSVKPDSASAAAVTAMPDWNRRAGAMRPLQPSASSAPAR